MEPIPAEVLLDEIPPELARIGERMRGLVREVLPDALERVRPGWRVIGYDLPSGARRTVFFAWILPQQEHIHLGFVHGSALDDPRGLLEGQRGVRYARWTTYAPGDAFDEEPLRALLLDAAFVAGLPRDARRAERRPGIPGGPAR
jgi:hypothetical protein